MHTENDAWNARSMAKAIDLENKTRAYKSGEVLATVTTEIYRIVVALAAAKYLLS